jgi:hypothetical protein
LLRKYERVKDPKEIRAWLMAYHGEAPGQQVMYVFAAWAISNPDGFIAITDGLRTARRKYSPKDLATQYIKVRVWRNSKALLRGDSPRF